MINKLYKLGVPETDRDDLVAVLLTGVPELNFTSPRLSEVLRLNLGIPVTRIRTGWASSQGITRAGRTDGASATT